MIIRPIPRMNLLSKIILLDVFMVAAMLILSVGLAARYSTQQLEAGLEQNLHNVAQLLATNEVIIKAIEDHKASPELLTYLDTAIANQNDVDIITLANMNAIRIYHPTKSRIGKRFKGDDEGRVLKGENYVSQATGTLGYQSRYFYPVFNKNNKQIGFVLVSMLMSNLDRLKENVFQIHLQTLGITFLIGVVAAALITMSIKRSLLGYEPDQIVRIFQQRGNVMDSLEEGLLAIDKSGDVILVNSAAQRILDTQGNDLIGKNIDATFPQIKLQESLEGAKDRNRSLVVSEENVLCDRIPITSDQRIIGAVAIIRDRSEVTRLAEQLTGVNHLIDALRANTHEFMNQLHVIHGLLQAGDTEEAKRYIMDIGQIQVETVSMIAKSVENRGLAALILGKINRCNELGIHMQFLANSCIPSRSRFLPTKSLITIVGNLVENAIDAINERGSTEDTQEIALFIHEDAKSLLISVDDTGIGLTPAEIQKMNTAGYTTKGENRGTGIGLIRSILENYCGDMHVDSEKNTGTTISLVFRTPRHLRKASHQGGNNHAEGDYC